MINVKIYFKITATSPRNEWVNELHSVKLANNNKAYGGLLVYLRQSYTASIHTSLSLYIYIHTIILSNLPCCRIFASMNWIGIGSNNGLSPVRRQVITLTNTDSLSIEPSGTNFSEIWTKIQLSAVITRSNLSRYYIRHCDNSGRKWVRFENHNRHPIPRPHGRAMGCLLWGFRRKLTAL